MKLPSFSVLHHPHLDESFIVRNDKIKSWLKQNIHSHHLELVHDSNINK